MISSTEAAIIAGARQNASVILVLASLACFTGIAIASAGGRSGPLALMAGTVAGIGLVAAAAAALEISVISAIRYAFIASFFFKSDLMLMKIDEIEDPSGLNVSLTLLLAGALFFYDVVSEASGRRPAFPSYFWLLSGALFLVAAASAILAGTPMLGLFSLFSLASSIFIAFVVASHFSRRDRLVQLLVGAAVGVSFTGCVALSQFLLDFPTEMPLLGTGTEDELIGTQTELLGRVPAFLRTPTEMAFVMSTLLSVIATPVIFRVRGLLSWQRAALASGVLLGSIAIVLSLARGSWIGLIVSIALPAMFGWLWVARRERFSYLRTMAAAALVLTAMLAPFGPRIYERLTGDDEGSAEIRLPLMETALNLIAENPITGVGLNNYRAAMTKYDETGIFVSQVFPNPVHNVFAHVTAEIGVPGGVLFCLMLLAAFYECARSLAAGDKLIAAIAFGIAVGLLAFVITAMKEPGSLGSARPPIRTLFLMIGAAFAVGRIHRQMMY